MSHTAQAPNDSDELQSLFDEISSGRVAPAAPAGVTEASPAAVESAPAGASPAAGTASVDPTEKMLAGIGLLTRSLHNSLRELGYDRALEEAASAIPDARERLAYVATLTEQAAQRALTAAELAKPIQDKMAAEATGLSRDWVRLFNRELDVEGFGHLVRSTRSYIDGVPANVSATNAQLIEIMMAQDFQDLTGQVIKKITDIIANLEQGLVTLLVENTPPERRSKEANSLLNGPVINAEGKTDVVTSQQQVDDLLESMGF